MRLRPLRMLSDDALAALAAAGDRRAFAAIYERYHQPLFRYCRSMVRSDEDARDTLQNAMASALRALDGERREISLRPWLYRLAHNEAVSLLRRRRNDTSLDEASELPGTIGADAETRERLRELVGDLRELPDQQRGALVMRELSGLDYAEIGTVFGITAAAATQAVYDARRGLQEFAEGRTMTCDAVQRLISANDRRSLRARKVRGHLRACGGCRDFQAALSQRPKDLAALAPALPAPAAAALLHALGGGGGAGAASTGGGVSALATAAGKAAGASALVKGVAVVAVAGTIATGAVEVRSALPGSTRSQPPSRPTASPAPRPANAAPTGASRAGEAERPRRQAATARRHDPAASHPAPAAPSQRRSPAGAAHSRRPAPTPPLQAAPSRGKPKPRVRHAAQRPAKARAPSRAASSPKPAPPVALPVPSPAPAGTAAAPPSSPRASASIS
jgi:RNA polymerase sigma factor (sigma-70 family)